MDSDWVPWQTKDFVLCCRRLETSAQKAFLPCNNDNLCFTVTFFHAARIPGISELNCFLSFFFARHTKMLVSLLPAWTVIHPVIEFNNLTIMTLGWGQRSSLLSLLYSSSLLFPLLSPNGSWTCGNHLNSVHKNNKSFSLYSIFILTFYSKCELPTQQVLTRWIFVKLLAAAVSYIQRARALLLNVMINRQDKT